MLTAARRSLNVGVVGLGNMGLPIARNIAFKARSSIYLQLHSRSRSKLKEISNDLQADGATCAIRLHHEYSTLAKWCDIIILCLKNQEAAEEVLLKPATGGAASALLSRSTARPGQIIIDHTTAEVNFARHCGEVAAALGVHYLDAPLSGSPRQAFQNQLVTMIGSNASRMAPAASGQTAQQEVVQRLYPILNMYCDHIYSMGESGAGQATKLLSAALVASHSSAAAEAMTIAHRLNLELSTAPFSRSSGPAYANTFLQQDALLKVLDASWASSTMLRRNAPAMQDILRNPDRLPPTSGMTVDHLLTDLAYLDRTLRQTRTQEVEGEEVEDPYPVLDASLRMLGAAREANMGDRDISAIVHFIEAADRLEKEEKLGSAAAAAAAAAGGEGEGNHHQPPPNPTGGKGKENVSSGEREKKKEGGNLENEFDGEFY